MMMITTTTTMLMMTMTTTMMIISIMNMMVQVGPGDDYVLMVGGFNDALSLTYDSGMKFSTK